MATSSRYCTACYHMAYHLRSLARRSASRNTQVIVASPESDSAFVCNYIRSSRSGVHMVALADTLASAAGLWEYPYVLRIREGRLAEAAKIKLNQLEIPDSVLGW